MGHEVDYKKLYEDALERAKAYHRNELSGTRQEMTEYIFPELAESDDERIRKSLIDFFGEQCDMSDVNGVYAYEVVAWLEKQKEQKPVDEEELSKFCEANFNAGKRVVLNNPEEYGLQKPAEWSYPYGKNETVDQLIAIAECLEMDGDCLFNGYKGKDCGKFLRELARRESENKHAEWSEEDKKALDILSAVISYNLQNIPTSNKIDRDNLLTLKRWKDGLRPQCKPTEDQLQLLKNAEHILYVDGKHVYSNAVHEAYEYLKNL